MFQLGESRTLRTGLNCSAVEQIFHVIMLSYSRQRHRSLIRLV